MIGIIGLVRALTGTSRASSAPPWPPVLKFPLTLPRFPEDMADINFRKIDIDAYDEDVLVETELYDPDPRDPLQVLNDTKQKASAVRSALSK